MTNLVTNLERSQKLKELGAPQDTDNANWYEQIGKKSGVSEWHLVVGSNFNRLPSGRTHRSGEKVVAYTLSELIEWLGDSFSSLRRIQNTDTPYEATVWQDESHNMVTIFKAATMLEAVFSLAVAIKQPDNE